MKPALIFSGRFISTFALTVIFQQIVALTFPRNTLLFFPSIALATFLMILLFDNKKKLDLGFNQPKSFYAHGMGFLFGILLISLSFFFIWLIGAIQILNIQFSSKHLSNLISLTILFFIVSFQEELLYRGYLYALAEELFKKTKISLFTTSFLFSITHALNPNALSNPIPLINIFLAGIVLGILRQYSNGIWMPIGFHWSWNLFQGGIYGFHVSGLSIKSIIQIETIKNVWLSGGNFGAEGSILTTILFLGLIIGIFIYYQRRVRPQ